MMTPSSLLIFLISVVLPSEAIHPIDYPDDWKDCLREIGSEIPVKKEDGAVTVSTCLDQFLFRHSFQAWHSEPTPEYESFKNEFCAPRSYEEEPIRVRKEYRSLTKDERKRFHQALNKLRDNGTYANIVSYHADSSAIPVAHGGPGFTPWHRIYLLRLEDELRKYEPDLAFPYWDCRIEADLYEEGLSPHWSKLWNNQFVGYGADIVTKGPFKDWGLRRRLGDGELPNRERVERLFNATGPEMTSPSYWDSPLGYLEILHNWIHIWVGGNLASIRFAPEDPLFFLLHCFVDYLWEEIRVYYEVNHHLNPEENFPDISNFPPEIQALHHPDGNLPGFDNLTIRDGYSKIWTRDVYHYEQSPAEKDCSECSDNDVRRKCIDICGKNLKCKNGKCVAKLLVPTFFDDFSQEFQPPTSRVRRQADGEPDCSNGVCDYAEPAIQNDFMCNGEDDTNLFKWVAIKLLHRRPKHQKFNTYAVHEGHIDTSYDLFDPIQFHDLEQEMHTGDPGTYDHCDMQSVESYAVVRSDSLSKVSTPQFETCPFSGKYAFDTEYAYIAVANPDFGPVNVSFIAYDQCGRLCTPYCRQADDKFARCTGLFHLDGTYDGYGANPSEVMFKQLHEKDGLPELKDDNIFLVFDCDASTEYFFEHFL
ncbi:uncharacterized protein LOC132558527 [Ylistrum balloti]|uniref:uncharacterized protein LOC132558527 n=1 Tax=Ylistrum balloti TaxID=509963 RepID=UPI002905F48D|nr:uncharacterized protein LOC132558527 [Ylistrum balloti]